MQELQNKTILLVNSGSIKKRFILQKLKKLGLKIILLHYEKNWAQAYMDEFILADLSDYDGCIRKIQAFLDSRDDLQIDAVITFWDDSVILSSKIAEVLGLPGIPFDVAHKVKNKYRFRQFCQQNHLPAPRSYLIHDAKDLKKIPDLLKFPLVIKPVFGAASVFVVKVEDREELKDVYDYVSEIIKTHEDAKEWDNFEIMVEEYIEGKEVDIDLLIQNGRIKFYTISDNYKTKEPFFVETGTAMPSNLPTSDQESLISMVDEVLEKLNIQNGCIHFEAKMSKAGPVPIEVNLRMGGDDQYNLIKKAWKVDFVENAVKIALGIYIPVIKKPDTPFKYLEAKYFLSDYSGVLSQLHVDSALKDKTYIEDLHFFKKTGDPILSPPHGYEYLGWINVSGKTKPEAMDNLDEAFDMVKYEVSKFDTGSFIGKTSRGTFGASLVFRKNLPIVYSKIERIRKMSLKDQCKLRVGVAGNFYDDDIKGVEKELMTVTKGVEIQLKERGYQVLNFNFSNLHQVINDIRIGNVDIIFNVCERINNSSLLEPHAASLMDIFNIPYTGSNPFTLALCIDKIRVKKLLTYHNIPTPKWDYIYSLNDDIRTDLKYPLIVKPSNTDNSIGITNDSVVTNKKDLMRQLKLIVLEIGSPALIEEYISGDEYDVSILGSEADDLKVLPLSRSIFDKLPAGYWHIYPHEAKFNKEEAIVYTQGIIVQRPPKGISNRLSSLIKEIALDTYNILDCHDYGRVEIKLDKDNNPYVLELNPNPSINVNDAVSQAAKLAGLDYGDFLEEIIRLAIKRYKNRPSYYHLQTNLI